MAENGGLEAISYWFGDGDGDELCGEESWLGIGLVVASRSSGEPPTKEIMNSETLKNLKIIKFKSKYYPSPPIITI